MTEEEYAGVKGTDDSLQRTQPSRGQKTEEQDASLSNIRHQDHPAAALPLEQSRYSSISSLQSGSAMVVS